MLPAVAPAAKDGACGLDPGTQIGSGGYQGLDLDPGEVAAASTHSTRAAANGGALRPGLTLSRHRRLGPGRVTMRREGRQTVRV